MPIASAQIADTQIADTRIGHAATALDAASPDMAAQPIRRLRRLVAYGPRCPDCAGPLAFGEGCSLCPVCGYSSCTRAR